MHAVYDELPDVLDQLGLSTVDSILFDLGVSSMQLDEAERGFAYAQDAPLDMRMDPTTGITAEEVVNTYAAGRPGPGAAGLRRGEVRHADRRRHRAGAGQGADHLLGPAGRAGPGRHPGRRPGAPADTRPSGRSRLCGSRSTASWPRWRRRCRRALDALALGGRIVVLSYQSLEDRIVKRALAQRARSSAPIDLPVELPGTGPTLRLLTRGAELPTEAEVAANPRAASVRLRAAERIDPDADRPTSQRCTNRERGGRSGRRRDEVRRQGTAADQSRPGGTDDADKGRGDDGYDERAQQGRTAAPARARRQVEPVEAVRRRAPRRRNGLRPWRLTRAGL